MVPVPLEVVRKWVDMGHSWEGHFLLYTCDTVCFFKFTKFLRKLPIQKVQTYKQKLSQN